MTKIKAPRSGVSIRMYRPGHGDCFLLSFKKPGRSTVPFHMLIDCGMKKGSHAVEDRGTDAILEEMREHTGGKLDVVVVTHEHEDHVSGFPKLDDPLHPFKKFEVEELWLAWTEDPEDDLANELRDIYGDKLLALAMAHHQLTSLPAAAAADTTLIETLEEFLELEMGEKTGSEILKNMAKTAGVSLRRSGDRGEQAFAAVFSAKIRGKRYKQKLQGLRGMAKKIKFLSPGDGPLEIEALGDKVRFYPFGPPRDRKLLTSLNPRRKEEFHAGPYAMGGVGAGLFAAFEARTGDADASPFDPRFRFTSPEEPPEGETEADEKVRTFYSLHYDNGDPDRRIDADWLDDAEGMALRLNSEVNNTSLVLGIELTKSRQVMLFTGDAQAGSWRSWADVSWTVDGQTVTAKDLLGRCTFYKVGHHGSHNATLNGTLDSPHANLSWMAQNEYADHFVAMIPTNKVWAYGKKRPWRHPMKAIEDALFLKAKSRVIMTRYLDKDDNDEPIRKDKPDLRTDTGITSSSASWKQFVKRTDYNESYVSYWLEDKL